MQYFRPPDPYFVGDCMPFFHEGTFYLYWLQDEGHHQGKNGLGGHQWALSTSRDLVNWTQHGLVIGIDEEWECSICTGSTFYHEGVFYGFYATRKANGTEHLGLAISADGIHFRKKQPNPFASPRAGMEAAYRDPFVFRENATGLFHMLVSAHFKDYPLAGRGGFLEHLISSDLRNWKAVEPFLVPGLVGTPECSDYFEWNGWYYLIFSCSGVARYRMSRNPLGPWTCPPVDTFNGEMAAVMKTAAFTGDRRIGVSFLWGLKDPANSDNWCYAGNAVFQEILQRPDGTLQSRFVPEMTPQGGRPLAAKFEPVTGEVIGTVDAKVGCESIDLTSPQSMATARMAAAPRDAHITLRMTPQTPTAAYGLTLRAPSRYESGAEIRLSPAARTIEVRSAASGSMLSTRQHTLNAVEGLDRTVTLEIVIKGDILDICINGQRCLVNRVPTLTGESLFLFCQSGQVKFDSIVVRPLESLETR